MLLFDCATVTFAELASAKVVGYNTVTIDKQWTILAVNFESVSGTGLSIQEAFPYQEGMTKGSSSTGDEIQVQNAAGGYDTYYLSDGNFKKMGKNTYYPERDGKWFQGTSTTEASTVLKPGQAFWYGAKNYATPFTVTVAGAVPGDATKSITVNQAWTHIANPYPFNLALNGGINYSEGMTKGSSSTGDEIQVQNAAGGYDTYYLSDGNFKKMGKNTYYPERDGKWFKGTETTETAGSIPVGKGAWYGRKGATEFSITITTPLAVTE